MPYTGWLNAVLSRWRPRWETTAGRGDKDDDSKKDAMGEEIRATDSGHSDGDSKDDKTNDFSITDGGSKAYDKAKDSSTAVGGHSMIKLMTPALLTVVTLTVAVKLVGLMMTNITQSDQANDLPPPEGCSNDEEKYCDVSDNEWCDEKPKKKKGCFGWLKTLFRRKKRRKSPSVTTDNGTTGSSWTQLTDAQDSCDRRNQRCPVEKCEKRKKKKRLLWLAEESFQMKQRTGNKVLKYEKF